MEETDQRQSDQDPAAVEHSDAERVTGKEADRGPERQQSEDERDDADAESERT